MRLKGPDHARHQAHSLRRTMSLPETILWQQVRKSALGPRVRCHVPAGRYILDFYCAPAKVAIEVDGSAHDFGDRPARDEARDRWLETQRVRVIRGRAIDVLDNLEGVLVYLHNMLGAVAPFTPPSAGSGPPPPGSSGED